MPEFRTPSRNSQVANTRLMFDAHLDIAWNAMSYDRDQLRSVAELRASESQMTGKGRGCNTVSLPELRRAGVGVCLATLLSRAIPAMRTVQTNQPSSVAHRGHGEMILREDLDYANQTIASAAAQGQLAYYRHLEQQGHLRQVTDVRSLDEVWSKWQGEPSANPPMGYILSMEGTDPILGAEHARWWWDQGLRTACLAHYGPSAYAMGTGGDGPLTDGGRDLLRQFNDLGMILDLVHTADRAFMQALEIFTGSVFVSHGNCRSVVAGDRQISDKQISLIAQRGGVLGVVMDNWMLDPNWRQSGMDRSRVSMADVVNHIDHICELTGNCDHVGIGSDLDGGFGIEQTPCELDTITDLHQLAPILSERGYTDESINAIFYGNWIRFFRAGLPKGEA